MALILSLETSIEACSVALHKQGELLAEAAIKEPQAHASKLSLLIQEVLSKANVSSDSLQAIAVSLGPGSYTGLRIGVSTAKGLCYALNIPLIAVNTLHLLAFQVQQQVDRQSLLCPMIDARRMEVYSIVYDASLTPLQPVKAEVIDELSYAELLSLQPISFFGNGAEKCKAVIAHHNARFIHGVEPLATSLGVIAATKYAKAEFEDLVRVEPFYLKEFQVKKSLKPLF